MLDDLAKSAFHCGAAVQAAAYATKLLAAARKYRASWNYGNAIHYGNTYLGRLANLAGKFKEASLHLRASLKHKGSPQLNSFGPSMELARELLIAGDVKSVVDYLEGCKAFWKNDYGALDHWLDEIRRTGSSALDIAAVMGSLNPEEILKGLR